MGGKSPGQAGAYDDPNPQPFRDNMRTLLKGAMTNMGPGFWGPDGAPGQAAAPAQGGDVTATPAAPPANIQLGATDAAAPAGSAQTTQDAGDTLAQAVVAPPTEWQEQMKKAMQPTGSMTITGQV